MNRSPEIIINFSGAHGLPGHHGEHGANAFLFGISGSPGHHGHCGSPGISALPIQVKIASEGEVIAIREAKGLAYMLAMGQSANSLRVLSNGGKGGDGGRGGDGGSGAMGFRGSDATRYSSGTNGGPGGNGGDGGDGGDVGHGGNGADIMVNVKYEDTDLLMVITEHQQWAGAGGSGGGGGNGGHGGPGGLGGSSYSWTTTHRNADGTESSTTHTNSGG